MKLNEIEVILFDLGNVVIEIDFSRVISEWQKFSGKNNIEVTKDSILGRTNEKYERGEISTAQFIESLKKELDLDITDEEVLEGWNKIFVGENLGIRDNIDRLVLKYPLYIFSNTSISHAEFWRNEYSELLKHFQKIFTSFELGMRKPEKESFLEVCSQIDVLPEKILFFDDTEENIVAANDLGMHAVKVDSIQDISETIDKFC